MQPDIHRTHQALDRAVDRLYRRSVFASEREQVELLFVLYEYAHILGGEGEEKTETAAEVRFMKPWNTYL